MFGLLAQTTTLSVHYVDEQQAEQSMKAINHFADSGDFFGCVGDVANFLFPETERRPSILVSPAQPCEATMNSKRLICEYFR